MNIFKVIDREEDKDEGEHDLRQININRDKALDSLMDFIRSGLLSKRSCELDDVWKAQLTDMRRIKDWDTQTQEIVYRWVKSEQGNDHFHHATLYMYVSSMVLGVARGSTVRLPLATSFKMTPPKPSMA